MKAILVLVISLSFFGALHYYFYSINEFYQPLHLLEKAKNIFSVQILYILPILLFLLLIFVWQIKIHDENDFLQTMLLVFLVVFLPLAYGDLWRLNFDFSKWEGANYIMPIVPFFLLQFLNNKVKDQVLPFK